MLCLSRHRSQKVSRTLESRDVPRRSWASGLWAPRVQAACPQRPSSGLLRPRPPCVSKQNSPSPPPKAGPQAKASLRRTEHHLLLRGAWRAYQGPHVVHPEAEAQTSYHRNLPSSPRGHRGPERAGQAPGHTVRGQASPLGPTAWRTLGTVSLSRVHHRLPAAPHLFALLVRGEGMSGSGAHGGAEGAAGALMAQVALAGPGLGGAQQLWVELAVGRGRCGREDQCLQGCHLCLQHVDLAGVGWMSTLVQG